MEMSTLTRDGTAEHISRDQILRRERGQGNIDLLVQLISILSCYMCDHTYIRCNILCRRLSWNKNKILQYG